MKALLWLFNLGTCVWSLWKRETERNINFFEGAHKLDVERFEIAIPRCRTQGVAFEYQLGHVTFMTLLGTTPIYMT